MVYGVQDPQALYNKHGLNGFYNQYGLYNNNQSPSLFGNGYASNSDDDGKISFTEKVGSFFKGIGKSIVNGVKSILTPKGLLKTAATVGACLIPGVGPVIAMGLAGVGVVKGVSTVVKGAKTAANATTDEEAKQAWENIGSGTFTTAISAVGIKGAAKAIGKMNAKAGTTSIESVKDATGLYNKAKVAYGNTKTTLQNAKETFVNNSNLGKNVAKVGEAFKNGEGITGKLQNAKETFVENSNLGKNVAKVGEAFKSGEGITGKLKNAGKTVLDETKAGYHTLKDKFTEAKQTSNITKESIKSKSKLIADSLKKKATESGWDTKDLGTVYISSQLKEANSEYEMYNEYLKSLANSNTGYSA